MDILPDIEFGPVGYREYSHALALGLLCVIEMPEFWPLAFRVPAMAGAAEGEDALFGTALLLVAPSAAERRVETIEVERQLQTLGLPHVGMQRAMVEGINAPLFRLRVLVDEEIHPAL